MTRTGVYHSLVYHFVWATKNRECYLTPTVKKRLFPYLAEKCKELGYGLLAVNAASEHLHVLLNLTPSVRVADAAKNLKGASAHYINHESGLAERLYWQDGYGVVTLRAAEIPRVVRYIQNQKEHHAAGKLSETLERIAP